MRLYRQAEYQGADAAIWQVRDTQGKSSCGCSPNPLDQGRMALAPADRTKVVIRNLPPLLTEADARALVDESGFKDRATWFHFVQGKSR